MAKVMHLESEMAVVGRELEEREQKFAQMRADFEQ